ncbi:MAG: extracellular solute-binding protein [Caldilineaceae bacterium]
MTEKLSRRAFLRTTAVASAGLALVACAPPAPATGGGGAAAPSTGKTKIRFHGRVGTQGDYYTEMAKAFNGTQDKIEVTVEAFPGTDPEYLQKITTMISGGTIGDAMWVASIHIYYSYAAAGVYVPIDDFIAKDKYDLSPFYPVAMQNLKVADKLYGLPWIVHPGRAGLWYNKALFKAGNQAEPTKDWTYDDLTNAAKALTVQEGGQTKQWGLLPERDYFGLAIPIRSYGGDWFNKEGTKVTVGEEPAVAGLKTIADIFKAGYAPTPSQVTGGYGEMFTSGHVAMWQSGYWGAAVIKSQSKDMDFGVVAMPKGPKGSHAMFEFDSNVILKTSKAPEAAWEFVKYLSTKEAGVRIAELGSVPGGRADVWDDPKLQAIPSHVVFAEIMKTIDPLLLPANFRYQEVFQVVENTLAPVWLTEKTLDNVLGDLTNGLQQVLDKPKL